MSIRVEDIKYMFNYLDNVGNPVIVRTLVRFIVNSLFIVKLHLSFCLDIVMLMFQIQMLSCIRNCMLNVYRH